MKLRDLFSRRPKQQIQSYRFALAREAERDWLIHWLGTCGLLQRIETDEQRVRHNMAIEMLEHLGAIQGENWERLVDAVLSLPVPKEAIEGE